MAITKYYNGTSWYPVNSILNTLSGSTNPTVNTVGLVGQIYTNNTTGEIFQCTQITNNTYTWMSLTGLKVNSISSSSTDDQYPTAKAVYDYMQQSITSAIEGEY